MHKLTPRDRQTPGRATGRATYTLRWASGVFLYPGRWECVANLDKLINSLRTRIEQVPLDERPQATAFIDADIRKANGGNPRVRLATWVGTESIEVFFSKARIAWKALPKEWEASTKPIPIEPAQLDTFKKP